MKKNTIRKKIITGGVLSIAALFYSCGGGGETSSTSTPYATITGNVSSSSIATGLSAAGITIGNIDISYIAAIAIENGKLVYTADDIDNNGQFDLKLKTGLKYAFILFDSNKLPVITLNNQNGNAFQINGNDTIQISLQDSNNDGKPDSVSISTQSGNVLLTSDPNYEDKDSNRFPDGIEYIDYGGTINPDYDEDGNGYFDGIEDKDNDRYLDGKEDSNSNSIPDVYEDYDDDNLPNYLDDSDGDGYPDHIDDSNDYYYYEYKGTVSSIDYQNLTFNFTYNGRTYIIQITEKTLCEIKDRYYQGNDCLNYLSENSNIELKTIDSLTDSNVPVEVVKFELEDYNSNYDNSNYKYEIYGFITNIDPENNNIYLNWRNNSLSVNISNNTKCEIYGKYVYGNNCFNYLKPDMCLEVKTPDDVYNGKTNISAYEIETSDDCYPYEYEMYGYATNIDSTTNSFTFTTYRDKYISDGKTYVVYINDNTVCEINDNYYIGYSCTDMLTENMFIELKTYDDIYEKDTIKAVKLENEYED